MKELKVGPGHFSEIFSCQIKSYSRASTMENKLTLETQTRKKQLRGIQKGSAQPYEAQEGLA